MERGQVIRMTSVRDVALPGSRLTASTWKAPPKRVIVAVVLGMEDRDGDDRLDAAEAMHAMGWSRTDDE